MSKVTDISKADRDITNKVISMTKQETLKNLFGTKKSYLIPSSMQITAITNKAFYKLSDSELYYLNVREKLAYQPLKALYTRIAVSRLGFDFNTNFGIVKEDGFNLQTLSHFEDKDAEQRKHIPLEQEIVDKIMAAPKFRVDIEKSPHSKFDQSGRDAEYYLCEVDGQVVPVVVVNRDAEIKNTYPVRYSKSVSVFVLLKGKVPFFVSRLDFNPVNKHTNRLENGKIATRKIKSRGTHQHMYSERFAILVPTDKRIMHSDAETYDFILSFEDAKKFVHNQINTTQEKNPHLEEIFKNNLKKAQKQKKYNTSSVNKKTNNFDDMNFNF